MRSLMDPMFELLPIKFRLKLETGTRQSKEMEKNLIQCVRDIPMHLKFSSPAFFNAVSDEKRRGSGDSPPNKRATGPCHWVALMPVTKEVA